MTPGPTNEQSPPVSVPPEYYLFVRKNDGTGRPQIQQLRGTSPTSFATWTSDSWMSKTAFEYSFAGVATVYDSRAVAARGLRAFRPTHRGCVDQPWACGSDGYWPGITSSSQLTCNVAGYCAMTSGGWLPSYIQYLPFAEGHNPTEYCSYDDWSQIDWAMCEALSDRSAPTIETDFIVTPYQLTPTPNEPGNVRCRNRHVFAEPTATGTCVSASTSASDRSSFPSYYYVGNNDQ